MQKIAILGASGSLGRAVLNGLLSAGFTVTALLRESSQSKIEHHSNLSILRIPDSIIECPIDDLVKAVSGQEALVITIAGSQVREQMRLADACESAGVTRIIPADFGSCDSDDQATVDILPLYSAKYKVRAYLQDLAEKPGSKLTWTSIIGGHFLDLGLQGDLLLFNVKGRKVDLLNGGNIRFSTSTIDRYGLAVARILQRPEETKNKIIYVQSACVSQNELLASLKRATGEQQWSVTDHKWREKLDGAREKADQGDRDAIEEVVGVWGIVASNWEKSRQLSNGLLGLENEDVDEIVKRSVSEIE
ncbi:NAD(P)-binding protein [Viridothelium virens]|uniref:NAD(P)-binding protein n=1 Tax=Viridothelium virens TaxID=1048519 RepID=A0A6A6HPR0_VIRVR|nr:NAD(P)-binding protein [Viridothelium virens]